jgi:hypothetical protein
MWIRNSLTLLLLFCLSSDAQIRPRIRGKRIIPAAGGGGAAVAVDGTTPASWSTSLAGSGTSDSASFTPPANSVLVLMIMSDGTSDLIWTPSTTGLTWTQQVTRNNSETTTGGMADIWTCPQASSAARVIRITRTTAGGTPILFYAKCFVVTGADISGTTYDSITANNEGGSTSNSINTTSITPGADGLLMVADCEWNDDGTPTSSDLTSGGGTLDLAGISVFAGYKTCTSGVAVTGNLDAFGAGVAQHKWVQIIVRKAP